MKHKQSIILVFFALFSFLFVNFSLFSMEYSEYFMRLIASNDGTCHSTGSKHIFITLPTKKTHQDLLNTVSCSVLLKNNKLPVVIVDNHLKISRLDGNKIKFKTTKYSRYYPLGFTISPNNYPVSNRIEPYTSDDHPLDEQQKFYRENEKYNHTEGPFYKRLCQEDFLYTT